MRLVFAALAIALFASGCAKRTTDIDIDDAGQAYKVKFGTVVHQTPVSVRTDSSGAIAGGVILGGGAGALIAKTNGAALGGALAGALAAWGLHEMSETNNAVEYTVALSDGDTIVIAQMQASDERVFQPGDFVMVQYGANTNRVLSADMLPEKIGRPKTLVVEGATPSKIDVKTCGKATNGRDTRESCTQH